MPSSRRTGTNENVSTFGNGTRDYTSVATWESVANGDSTVSMITEVLEMFDDLSPYDQRFTISGGVHSITFPLILRAAVGHENRFSTTDGVIISNSSTTHSVGINDNFVYLIDLGFTLTASNAGTLYAVHTDDDDVLIADCNFFDGANGGAGSTNAIQCIGAPERLTVVNTGVQNWTGSGLAIVSGTVDLIVYNSTFKDGVRGVENTSATTVAKNVLSDNNSTADFSGSFAVPTSNNASSDPTAPGTSPRINQTFTFDADLHLASSDVGAKDFGADLSADAVFAFDDDIDGAIRNVPWDIGGDEVSDSMPLGASNRRQWTIGWYRLFS